MKNHLLNLTAVVCLFVSHAAQSQTNSPWTLVHSTPAFNFLKFCKAWDANTWYMAGNDGWFLKTTDGGESWFVNQHAGVLGFHDTLVTGSIMDGHFFDRNNGILAGQGGLTRTTDGGVTFDSIAGTTSSSWRQVFFSRNNIGYAVGYAPTGFARSTDGGLSWTPVSIIPYPNGFSDVYTFDDSLIFVVPYTSPDPQVLRSTDAGATWTVTAISENGLAERVEFSSRDTGFVIGDGVGHHIIMLTTDAGLTWVDRSSGLPPVSSMPSIRDIDFRLSSIGALEVYLTGGLSSSIHKSTDLGLSWEALDVLDPTLVNMSQTQALDVDILGDDSLLVVGYYGYIFTKFGTSRRCYTKRVKYGTNQYARIEDLCVLNSKVWAVGGYGSGGNPYPGNDQIMYSPDGGTTWQIQPTPAGMFNKHLKRISMVNENTGYVAGTAGVIAKTTDGGATWVQLLSPTAFDLTRVDFIDESTGWVFGEGSTIFKTTDGGVSWEQQSSSTTAPIYAVDMVNASHGWFVGPSGTLRHTTDGGTTWLPQNPNAGGNGNLYDIKMVDADIGYLVGHNTIRKTTDGGATWITIPSLLPSSFSYYSVDFCDAFNGIICGLVGTVFRTTNGGVNWIPFHAKITGSHYATCIVSPNTMFVGGDQAAVFRYGAVTSVSENPTDSPTAFALHQNYPNPFNPTTTIEFSLPRTGRVSLKVFDILGREVAVLVDELDLNPGTVKSTFDARRWSSGVYLYSLIVDGRTVDSRKMLLLK